MPTLTATYAVLDGQPVHLTVSVGDAQAGGSTAFLGKRQVASGPDIDLDLGTGDAIRGQTLVVDTLAVDVQPATDHVSARVALSGGTPAQLPLAQGTTAPTHGAVSFLTVVRFV